MSAGPFPEARTGVQGCGGWVARLRQFTRKADYAQCELCGASIVADHAHLFDTTRRQLHCCCRACALLFGSQQGSRYRPVPRAGRYLDGFRMSDAQWDALAIPIDVAFFFVDSGAAHVVALYPGPAGGTRSQLGLAAWDDLVADNPDLTRMRPDVEALLVYRAQGARDYFLAPIDQCYALTGLIRARWRGLSGGKPAWEAIRGFVAALKATGRVPEGLLHA
ncbi:DUF5947 domain-containing protein (plasmid) [Cupriavidus necator H16]|uniref:Uncharacterized protein n=1 Tax=Cupriavidus necator (strain ATCC 17699 / DSM 428 / KCTC 22496 / NCIMB 10442 / H16 / Stanier 337) TaxID=381666 RepID=Q7WXQ1_CUPNH|nr:DUF5947 family protein [Cupriavidus necator]AAP85820.1 hypothetical protein PHG067 [Cupriavidus necator H16]QCC05335.1 hypothetical protein E6A55_32510 [Cupriavidus necator H16]QQB81506.1 hypothetical protein I6H87_32505 [Cupriavidus necator]